MDFSSLFLDPPTWHQQEISEQVLVQTDPVQIQPTESGPGLIKPGSMVDRARQAQLPLPEPGLKCPRCDSTNTKFCYFNNYNLSQPRHFCKGCRRYWTRGGALRNVPVGGGCRRNKRTKSRVKTGSKNDPVSTQNARRGTALENNNTPQLILPPSQPDPFLPGLGYRYLNGFGLYPFNEGSLLPDNMNPLFGSRVKVDENQQGLNLSKNVVLSDNQNQYSNWGLNGWSDISGFQGSSSSSGHH